MGKWKKRLKRIGKSVKKVAKFAAKASPTGALVGAAKVFKRKKRGAAGPAEAAAPGPAEPEVPGFQAPDWGSMYGYPSPGAFGQPPGGGMNQQGQMAGVLGFGGQLYPSTPQQPAQQQQPSPFEPPPTYQTGFNPYA